MKAAALLRKHDERLLLSSEGRKTITRNDPALFALIYLSHHLKDAEGTITFAKAHDDWYRIMRGLAAGTPKPRGWRKAFVAPRETGKSTTWFLIAPLWSAAHGHSKFTAAFADTASQAETHLQTFRHELANNGLLQQDYPELCEPGSTDTRSMFISKSGYVFAARGADTSSLGLKVGATRPDLLILDDIEPGESNYSPFMAEKRLSTLLEVILPLNERARVMLVGTVTMPGSIIHQLVLGDEPWIEDEQITTVHHKALYEEAGELQSLWPEKWPIDFMLSIQHTRAFAKNFQNSVTLGGGDYWDIADISYGNPPADLTRTILAIDPAVTSKTTSDFTGLAVITFDDDLRRMVLRHTEGVRLAGRGLRAHVEKLMTRFPEIRVLLIETNQGGEVWQEVFRGIPLKYRTTFSKDPKHVRAAELLEHYQRGKIVHQTGIFDRPLVEELLSFPKVLHDDRLDAVAIGARYWAPLTKPKFTFAVA